ncbi:hypothetical protein DXG03_003169 [Asterophora parasitica]|uniref:Uncharacterized protein n=1 Tax=Asterophora parasitica TaxID=117018 RepID=A0A9P7GH89_9AGAR|nr:hypothetical protein DXG03_003169 [Asterophora parasitica]
MSSSKKPSSERSEKHIEDVQKDVEQSSEVDYSPEVVRKLLYVPCMHAYAFMPELKPFSSWKIDVRMLPLLGLLYAVALIDRTNLGIARVANMEKDLVRYESSFSPCLLTQNMVQLPSNVVLRVLGARVWLTICVLGWGVAQLGMGFVPTWGYLVLCRVFLGVFEVQAPRGTKTTRVLLPVLHLHRWIQYNLWHVHHPLAVSNAHQSTAYALTQIAPAGGLNGWQWIFIIEGIITIVLGILTYIFVPDFPDKNRFLTSQETQVRAL